LSQGANGSSGFYENKIATGRFFMERVLPETALCLARIQTGSESMMALKADDFLVH